MRILFVAATAFEVSKLISDSVPRIPDTGKGFYHSLLTTPHSMLITGVGMVATACALGRELALNKYDLAVNLGIAGSFDRGIALGELIEITKDTLSELGAEDGDNFLPISHLGFGQNVFKANAKLSDFYNGPPLQQATAITVNTVHGNEQSVNKLQGRIDLQLESMEGAAFFYACNEAGVPCIQIRAVSNYVEKRNRDAWQVELAVKNLNTFATALMAELKERQ